MSRPTRAEMNELAADREKSAARSTAAANSALRDAADESLSPETRRQAAAQEPISRSYAAEARDEAAKLREGYLPGEDW